MTQTRWHKELEGLNQEDWPLFLDRHSGLPGPRANLELATALADLADAGIADDLIASGDEYRSFCGVIALGDEAADPAVTSRLRHLACDERWRIREAVAMALQRLGDTDFAALKSIVLDWATDLDPLVRRAAAAAICEPRLLSTPHNAAVAVEVCRLATNSIAEQSPTTPRDTGARTLRKALGYCWSVAIAADPDPGLNAFDALDDSHPDIAWIIKENAHKKRLSALLGPAPR